MSERSGEMNFDDVLMFGDRVRCPTCREMVPIPTDGKLDPTDMRQIDFVMEHVRPRLAKECPNHER
jgi:hypothetical protein